MCRANVFSPARGGNRARRAPDAGKQDHPRGGTELRQIPQNELFAGHQLRNWAGHPVFLRRTCLCVSPPRRLTLAGRIGGKIGLPPASWRKPAHRPASLTYLQLARNQALIGAKMRWTFTSPHSSSRCASSRNLGARHCVPGTAWESGPMRVSKNARPEGVQGIGRSGSKDPRMTI